MRQLVLITLISGCASPQPWTWKTQVMPTTRNLQSPRGRSTRQGAQARNRWISCSELPQRHRVHHQRRSDQRHLRRDRTVDVQDPRLSRMLDRIFDSRAGVDPVALQLSIAIDAVRNDLMNERVSSAKTYSVTSTPAGQTDSLRPGTRLSRGPEAGLLDLLVVYPRTSAERNEVGPCSSATSKAAHTTPCARASTSSPVPFRTMLQTDSDAIMTPWTSRSAAGRGEAWRFSPEASPGEGRTCPVLSCCAPLAHDPVANTIRRPEDLTIGERREQFDDHRFAAVLMDSARVAGKGRLRARRCAGSCAPTSAKKCLSVS